MKKKLDALTDRRRKKEEKLKKLYTMLSETYKHNLEEEILSIKI